MFSTRILLFSFCFLVFLVDLFSGVISQVDATMLSCLPVVSVIQEKVRVFPGRRLPDVQVMTPSGSFPSPVAEGILTAVTLTDKSEDKVFSVGCLLPLSGLYADYGLRFLQGMELALEVYSGDELRQGRRIKLLVRDTRGMADAVIPLVHELVKVEHVSLLIGPVVGQVAKWAAKEALALNIPIITLTSQPGIAGLGQLVFQHFITARNQAEELVRLMVGNIGRKQPLVLYPDTPFGRTFSGYFIAAASRAGLTPVKKVEYQSTATDFGLVIQHIIDSRLAELGKKIPVKSGKNQNVSKKSMVLVLPGSSHRLNLLLPQLFHYGLDNVLVYGSRDWHELVCGGVLPHGLKEVLFVDAFSASEEGVSVSLIQYRESYKAQFKKKASLYDAYGYDTVMLIKQVVGRLSGWPVGGEQLATAIQTLPEMDMVTGITNLRPDGEIEKRLYRFMVGKGSMVIYP
jgi:ABC-type branched-subunit amino acid transport system substrate-binding protein